MNIDSNKTAFGDTLWKRLSESSAIDLCIRAGARLSGDNIFEVIFLGKPYRAVCAERLVLDPTGNPVKSGDFVLLLLTYLLNVKDIALRNEWVSEKDLPGGSFFFRGPHALPIRKFLSLFETDARGFISLGESFGGTEMPGHGDACIRFQVLPRIPIACVLWTADEEFPARMTYLFDPTITQHFALDVVLAMVFSVVHAILPR